MENSQKKYLRIPNRRFKITRKMIEDAIENTNSNSEASRWLGIAFNTYKKYAKMFNLYDGHKNQSGKGLRKVSKNYSCDLDEILNGKHPEYSTNKLKKRLIENGYIVEECSSCGWNESRITDGKICLTLDYIDGDDKNKEYKNLRLLCSNCYFTNVGNFKNAKFFC